MTNRSIAQISVPELKRALAIREQIEALEQELNQVLAGNAISPGARRPKRVVSARTRALLAAAQRARWAKVRKERGTAAKAARPASRRKGKRKLSPQAKANISAAAKARWARFRAAKKA